MSALTTVIAILVANADLDADVHPVVIPQTADLPCCVVTLIAEDENIILGGATGSFESLIAVSCLAESAGKANALGERVKTALGYIVNQPVDGGGTVTMWKSGSDLSDYDDDRTVFRRVIDFHVRWSA